MAKQKRATEQLNVSLSGLESALTIIETFAGDNDGPLKQTIKTAKEYAEEMRGHLLTIQSHIAQI